MARPAIKILIRRPLSELWECIVEQNERPHVYIGEKFQRDFRCVHSREPAVKLMNNFSPEYE